jgi:hypothetical protein
MGVNWLDSDTSVVSLGVWGLTKLTQLLQSFIWEVWGLNGLTQSLQSFIWEVWGLTGLTQSLQSFIWGYGG